MTYSEFCKAIGTDCIFPEAEELYNKADADGELTKPVRFDLIPKYFPHIKDDVTKAAKEIENDALALKYMNFLRVTYFAISDAFIPFLVPEEGSIIRNFAPAISILDYTANMENEMKKREVDDITADKVRTAFERALIAHKETYGFYAIKDIIYFWDKHYLIPDLFPIETLEFEVTKMPNEGTYFKSKNTGEIITLIDVSETDMAYCGSTVKDGGDADENIELSKAEYECVLKPGDWVVSVHIPAGTKLDSESCQSTYKKALSFILKAYPEIEFKAMYVRSWLMNPQLGEFLGEKSNILSFQSFYKRFPIKSSGKEVFGFVFPRPIEKYEDIPESTTLERGLKKRYLESRPIYVYAGIHLFEEDM